MKRAICQSPGETRSRVVTKGEIHHEEVEMATPGGKTHVWHRSTPPEGESCAIRAKRRRQNKASALYARRLLKAPAEMDPEESDIAATVLFDRGHILLRSGDLSEAEAEFLAALVKNPRCFGALCNLGFCLVRKGDFIGAEAKYRVCIEIDGPV